MSGCSSPPEEQQTTRQICSKADMTTLIQKDLLTGWHEVSNMIGKTLEATCKVTGLASQFSFQRQL